MTLLKIKSVAPTASVVEDIIIRESGTTRLLLRPIIVNNNSEPNACVKGAIIYQKKNDAGNFVETDKAFSFSNVKKGQYCKFDLKSEEVLTLLQKYDMLRELYRKRGLSPGDTTYCITEGNLGVALEQISKFGDRDKLIKALSELQDEDANKLSLMVSISKIDNILNDWEGNKTNSDEGFWQRKFEESSWVLSQVFACPYIYIKDKPYLGGKEMQNMGGNYSDFLMKQNSSDNIAFVEIKTPATDLIGALYRGANNKDRNAVFPLSKDLSGSINPTTLLKVL